MKKSKFLKLKKGDKLIYYRNRCSTYCCYDNKEVVEFVSYENLKNDDYLTCQCFNKKGIKQIINCEALELYNPLIIETKNIDEINEIIKKETNELLTKTECLRQDYKFIADTMIKMLADNLKANFNK